MLRQANQYNVPMPTTYITEVPFLRVKDTQEEILALEGGIDTLAWNVDEKSTYTAQQTTIEDLEYGSHWHDIIVNRLHGPLSRIHTRGTGTVQ